MFLLSKDVKHSGMIVHDIPSVLRREFSNPDIQLHPNWKRERQLLGFS